MEVENGRYQEILALDTGREHLFLRSGCIAGIAGTDLCGNL